MKLTSILEPQPTLKSGQLSNWQNFPGSSLAVAISELSLTADAPILVVEKDTASALRLAAEINSLLKPHQLNAHYFPDWETLPYDNFSPHQDIISQRLQALHKLTQKKGIFIVSANTLMMRMAPVDFINQHSLLLNQGDSIALEKMRERLVQAGYRLVDQVMEHGEFSVRGSLLDLYPMGSQQPYRIDLFDDEIDSIRTFDPDTQRSSAPITAINLLPAHEFPTDNAGIETFRVNWRAKFEPSTDKDSIYYQVSKKIMPAGIEYYQPLFFTKTSSLFDYLPANCQILFNHQLHDSVERFIDDVRKRYESRRYDKQRPILPVHDLFLRVEEAFAELKKFARIELNITTSNENTNHGVKFACQAIPDIAVQAQLSTPYKKLQDFLKSADSVIFSCESQGRRESVIELLKQAKIKVTASPDLLSFLRKPTSKPAITVSELEHSFVCRSHDKTIAVICEAELLGQQISQRRRRSSSRSQSASSESVIKNLAELKENQPVVHIDHGVGRYIGLQSLDAGGLKTEFVTIAYADSKLYVPVASLHLISRYSGGDAEHAPLHKLSSDSWDKAKRKALEKVRDVAADLLDVYARRSAKPGFKFSLDKKDYQQFCAGFPFEETQDQKDAITNVIADMQSDNAMDRLVCGDVGFGKTEVAMRAAFIAINSGKQVAVLVPTTLLAQQHFENFKDRFADWPVRVEVLSRFNSSKQENKVLEALAAGQVDLVIGTHKLLSKNIKFNDLGLLIVDEEHRFGVKQKELIKSRRADVDILTLTATPIPRTLNMAMSGMRDLSIIATPPKKRLAVKTFVRQKDDELIKEAVTREIMRGGQVYFLHNSVETIDKTAAEIQAIVPEANVIVAHGQMRERELERVMGDFYHQRFNVLVCTTIIETGIDVPSANTIIIDRADNFGLAQLHQLRGRVGRSHHQAYAYLMTPHPKRMTKDAVKRLDAIAQLEDLGAGFTLATHDLEIRGAGELLGEDQSGQISSIGFSLYMEMLEQAVESLKQGKEPSLDSMLQKQTDIELRAPALFPDDYIFDVNTRLSLYKKLASCKNENELDDFQVELIDRFGLLPDAAKNLIKIASLKLKAARLGINKIEAGPKGGYIEFSPATKVDPAFIIGLIQSQPRVYSMGGADKLRFNLSVEDTRERFKLVESMISQFEQKQSA
ncbi:transcription-repair coupling factor [Gayadomonas joobiniege]|uniref:transcription-repair coupling factor n=1 Tax=Gayadomonas joobiniege TaxID=1234606 RepID=UPI000366B9FE|nr:transcription-repair coupling factor [Gayadomonas joobiniege]